MISSLLKRMFGEPSGLLGKLGGLILARTNRGCAAWVVDLLGVRPGDKVLEIGFGPGVGIELLAGAALAGYVAGVDSSKVMVAQAKARNKKAIESGQVDLRHGFAASLPFASDTFEKALAINSMHIWPDALAGLREMRRVLRSGGKVALGFTPHSGQRNSGLAEMLTSAGFVDAQVAEKDRDFCGLAVKT
jgi:ubiquinone/menaquinone biosynthesis C-methylase UbiE